MKLTDFDRKIKLVEAENQKTRSDSIRQIAKRHGISPSTLQGRMRRFPDQDPEVLAKRPMDDKSRNGREGSHTWAKVRRNEVHNALAKKRKK